MALEYVNNYDSTLASGISNTATTLPLVAGGGTPLAGIGAGNYFIATIVAAANPNTFEIIHITAVSGDNLTIVRGQEGTTALNWSSADLVQIRVTAGGLATFITGAYVLTFVGRSGAVVAVNTDYAAFYPQFSTNNVFTGNNTFNGTVTVAAAKAFATGNIDDVGTGGGVTLRYAGGANGLQTVSAGVQVNGNLTVTGTGNFNTSSLEFKKDVRPLQMDADKFLMLEPIAYTHKATGEATVGFSAEQMAEICPELVQFRDGKPYAVNYQGLIPYLLMVIKEQQNELRQLLPRIH